MYFTPHNDLEQELITVPNGEAEAEAVAQLITQLPPEDAALGHACAGRPA